MTPWEGHTRLIGLGDISYKGASDLLSLNNHTQSPKSLIKSVEIFPKFISYLLVDHTQSVKPLHVSDEKNNEDTLNSPYQAHDTGTWNDTGGKCQWLPNHNQCPDVHGKPHETLLGLKDKKRKTLGDNFLKRKEIGIKDKYKRNQYKRTQYKRIQDTFGEKCHQEPQHHEGIGRDHKEIYGKMIHDKMEEARYVDNIIQGGVKDVSKRNIKLGDKFLEGSMIGNDLQGPVTESNQIKEVGL